MRGVAGLVFQDIGRTAEHCAQTAAAPSRDGLRAVVDRGVTLLPVGEGAWSERVGDAAVVGDLDISSRDETLARPASGSIGRALLERYREFGSGGLASCLRGAFALALWFPGRRRLVVMADRFGFRRVYYAATSDGLAFGPRLENALALGGGHRDVDPAAVYAYLNFGTVPAPQTMYRGVKRLPPGQVLVWEEGRLTLEPYWDVAYSEEARPQGVSAAAIVARTEEAVRQVLVGTEPKTTGAFLSGGTDSSTVVGLMTRLSGEGVNAFSIGFREERYNELEYAELAARHFSAAHFTHLVTADEAFACLPDLVAGFDEPFGNNSAIPTYLGARLAREAGMDVLLAGDGGDEIFGGNERYRREQILARYHLIPGPLRRGFLEPILRRLPDGGATPLGKAQRYVARASRPNPERFYSSEFFVAQERALLLNPEFLRAIDPRGPLDIADRHYRAARASSELNRLLYVDLKITLGDNDLLKVTRAADLAGLAVRFPLLDHPLVELTATLPVRDKVRGTEKRYLFKHAFASLLPREILAKTKHGFGLPVGDWLRGHRPFVELARDTLSARRSVERGYFAPGAVDWLFRQHAADATPFYGDVLWTLMMLELWHVRREATA
jgi:asparagine synthase (glutamine-hydrolysing)